MKKSRFTEEQIIYALRLAEGGSPVADVCRQLWCRLTQALGMSCQHRGVNFTPT
jgi:hypothetical protein